MGLKADSKLESFSTYFRGIYNDRWDSLYLALQAKPTQVFRANFFAKDGDFHLLKPSRVFLDRCYEERTPIMGALGLLDGYVMDPASVVAARALQVQQGDRVLDMCAAPGGKSLILTEGISESGELFSNDISAARRARLTEVIKKYIPRDVRSRIWVTGKDAVQFGLREANSFDRVLLDAPCSGERHLLEGEKKHLEDWSPRRTEHMASRQYSLLAAALLACRFGGRIVYSTCSMSPAENDGVIQKLIKKKKDQVQLIDVTPGMALDMALDMALENGMEKTQFGYQFLPDRCGFGPIYFCILEKVVLR